jgi:lysyl-tRNA synthetase, class II
MLSTLVKELMNTSTIKIYDRDGNLVDVDFNPPWPILCLTEVIKKDSGIDISDCRDADTLRLAMQKKNITLDVEVENLAFGNLTDQLYKKISRPKIVQPTFITHHPVELSPLSRLNDDDPRVTDRFQLVVGGWEIVNAYSELVDPVDQAKRFEQQAKAHAKGDRDAHGKDDEYVKALEYGCPPCSGFGMGIDRIVALLTKQTNLRDVVLFPLLKPDLPSS